MLEAFFLTSVLLLVLACVFWVVDRFGRSIRVWRRILTWVCLITLTCAIGQFGRYLLLTQEAENANWVFNERLSPMLHVVRVGTNFAALAFVSCWFATRKTLVCASASTLIIGFLWLAQLMGV